VTIFTAQEIRVEALAEPELTSPPAVIVPSTDVLWQWDATAVAPFFIHAKPGDPPRVTLVQAGGRNAVRLLTMPGDNNVNGSNLAERCDLRLGDELSDAKEGREWWFKHSVLFPEDYVDQPQSNGMWHWGSVMNWHDDADDGGSQGPLQLMNMPRTAISPDRAIGLTFQVYGGVPGSERKGQFFAAPIARNVWYDFTYHVKWTSLGDGFCDGWLNGVQFMAYRGPTLYTGRGAYLKLANYHTAHGKPSAVLHGRVIRASTQEALA
jgi:hypothetical protein